MHRAALVLCALVAGLALSVPAPLPETAVSRPVVATPAPAPGAVDDLAVPLPTLTPTLAPAPAPPRSLEGARIVLERLGIDLPLLDGDVARDVPHDDFAGATPEHVALVFPGSAFPGAGGNTYVYSHARVGMFLSLWQVRIDDIVLLRWADGRELAYRVGGIFPRVDPSDTSWLDMGGPERLTLQTSTGPRPTDPRFIAIAVPMGQPS